MTDKQKGRAVSDPACEDVGVSSRGDAHFLAELLAGEREVAGRDLRAGIAALQFLERGVPERQHLPDSVGLEPC